MLSKQTTMRSSKLWLLIALLLFSAALLLLVSLEDKADVKAQTTPPHLPPVSVMSVTAGKHRGSISVYAEINPRWHTTVTAHVSGELQQLSLDALAGKPVKRGQHLLSIESSLYQAQLHEAEQMLAEANILLKKEQLNNRQVKRSSQATLNKPQLALALARKTVQAATSRVDAAKTQLSYAIVTAPFPGYIRHRHVSLGQSINTGQALFDIIGNQTQQITALFSESQWHLIDKSQPKGSATLHDENGHQIGTATISHSGDFVDSATRQYSLYLTVDTSQTPIPVGSFVQIRVPTLLADNSLKLPAGSLTQDGFIWFVTEEQQLRRFLAEVLFYQDDWVVVRQPKADTQQWQIATLPLASFLPGAKATPIEEHYQREQELPQ